MMIVRLKNRRGEKKEEHCGNSQCRGQVSEHTPSFLLDLIVFCAECRKEGTAVLPSCIPAVKNITGT